MGKQVVVVGDCPVCSVSSRVFAAKNAKTLTTFFFCPSCGLAWNTPPEPGTLDEMNDAKEFARGGVVFPEDDDFRASLVANCLVSVEPYDEWKSMLEDFLDDCQ